LWINERRKKAIEGNYLYWATGNVDKVESNLKEYFLIWALNLRKILRNFL